MTVNYLLIFNIVVDSYSINQVISYSANCCSSKIKKRKTNCSDAFFPSQSRASYLWWTAMTEKELQSLQMSLQRCWRRTSWKTLFCWCLLTNRTFPMPYQSASSQTNSAYTASAPELGTFSKPAPPKAPGCMKDLTGYLKSCPRTKEGLLNSWESDRETKLHVTGEKAQTFNPETFGLPAPMFTKRTKLVDNI